MKLNMPNWFKQFIVDLAKAYHPRYTEANSSSGIAIPTKQNLPANVVALRHTIWAYICISKINRTVAGLPMRFYSGELNDRTKEQTSGDIVDLIKRPNSEDTHRELWQDTVGFLLGTGNAYWALDQVSEMTGRPVTGKTALWTLPAHRMEIIPAKGDPTKRISHYIAKTEMGEDVRYEPNEVVQFKLWNLESQYHGMAPLTVAMPLMETDYSARKHNRLFFKNGASPGVHLSTEQNYNAEAEKRIIDQFQKNQSVENSHKLIVTWAGLKAEDLKKNPKDLDFINLIKLNREEIIALFGVPPAEVGLFEFANYANALAQKELFWQETIVPMLQLFETRLNEHVFPRWTDKPIWMEFDTSGVAVLQGDLINKAKVSTTLVSGGIITPNEARAEYGRDPIVGGTADELKEPSRIGTGVATVERSMKSIKGFDPKAELWWKQDIERRRLEGKFFDIMKSYFAGLERRVIKSLSAFPDDAILTPDMAGLLYNELVEQEIVEKTTTPLYQSAVKDAGQSAIDEVKPTKSLKQDEPINIGIVFDEFDPLVQAWIEAKVARFVTQISDTTIQQIRDVIAEGNANGWTITQLAVELGSIDRLLFSNSRALTIAQTEMGAAANAGAMEGYKQSGVVQKKEWITARDQFVRGSHAANESAGAIGFGETFPNGLQHPLELGAPASEVVNCRCRIVGIVEGDTEV